MDSTLSLIGLAPRAGKLAVGEAPCALVCRARDCRLLLLASDAGASTLRRAQRMAEEGQCLTLTLPWDREALDWAWSRGLLPETAVSALLSVDPYNYILKIPVLPDISTVSDVEVEKSGELYTMSLKDGEYRMDSRQVDEEEYNTAYQKLLGILITGELPEGEAADTEEEPILTLRFFRNTDEASDIEVVYYPYDDSHAAISINDTEFFLADLDEVENVCEEFF